MRHRPEIEDGAILAAVRSAFNLPVQALDFLPLGEGAWVYKGGDQNGRTWFIKLSRGDTLKVGRVAAYLHDGLRLNFVLAPLVSGSPEQPKVNGYYLTVYPFIEGEVLGDADATSYKAEIGRDLRALHDARLPQTLAALLPRESFEKFQASARELVTRARSYRGDDPLKQRLVAYMQIYAEPIDAILTTGARISDYCKHQAHTYELVACHADIHPFNIMRSPHGLVMIDWDGIMLAPRERDLMFYAGDMRSDGDFHQAYGVEVALNESLIAYYNYEWVLQEFTDYIDRLFDDGLGDDARGHALDEFIALFGHGHELGGVVRWALDAAMPANST